MADLGNLKILLDMATTGNLKSTLENVDKRLDKMREKAASLQLGFDDKSVSALSTKMRDIAESMHEVSRNAGTKLAEGLAKSAETTKVQVASSEALIAAAKKRVEIQEQLNREIQREAELRRNYDVAGSISSERYRNMHTAERLEREISDNEATLKKWKSEFKKVAPTVDDINKINEAKEKINSLTKQIENLKQRLNEFGSFSSHQEKWFSADAEVSAAAKKWREQTEIVKKLQRELASATAEVDKLAQAEKQEVAAPQKEVTNQIQQQVALSADLEALFKEMAGTIRTIAEGHEKVSSAKRATVTATKEEAAEEQKLYDITRLRQMAEEKKGQLTQDQVSVLKQMEAIEKALVAIDEKYATNLAKELQTRMHYDGVTKAQIGTYQSLITRMQAAMQVEQKAAREAEKANRQQKQAAKEREAAAKRQAQLETTIIRIETQLLGINEARLSSEAQLLVQKMRNQQITQEEASRLSAILTQHRAIVNAEKQKGEAAAKTNAHLGRQSGLLQQITSYLGTYFSVMGAASLIKNLVRITGEFEAQHVALRAILQDVAGADRIFYQLQELAVKSPFTFRNLTDYAKQLSAFSVPMNEIYDTTKRLADVSAGLGVDMSRIILAYGQIRSASFLRGQEVRQLTESGIPVLQELAKQFKEVEGEAITVGKVFDKISARQVPFEMIDKMFKDLTSEGGKFYQMQETLAETVNGKISNLQDAWEIMLSKVGEDNSKFIKGVLDGVTNLIKNYKELARAIELAAVAYGTYRMAATAAAQAESMQRIIHLATGKNVAAIPALLTKIGVGLKKIPGSLAGIVTKLNPVAIAIAAVTTAAAALIMHLREMNKHIRETDKLTSDAIAKAEASKSNIQYYINQMKAAKEGTEEYNRARQAVIDNSGAYISATDAERLSLQSVDDVWVNICNHIEEATKLQAMQSITENAEATKLEEQMTLAKELADFQNDFGLSNEARQNIAAYMRREITRDELARRLGGQIKGASPSPYKSAYDLDGNVSIMGANQYVSNLDIVLDKADDLWDRFYASDRKFQETLAHGKQNLSDLYGTGTPEAAGEPAPLTGWRLRVQQYLDSVTGSKHGVSVSDETSLPDLAEQGAKALNDLRKSLELIPKDEADYKVVENDIKFWEGLSEAIYGPGNTEFNNSTKLTKRQLKDAEAARKERIAAIKQAAQDLKEAKRWYDQLTPLLGSKNAQTLLASFNFVVPKEGFMKEFQKYADELKRLGDENSARDVMNWANGREVGDVLKSAKAIEKYTEALRDLEAQTKRLNFSGLAAEIDKIIVDTDSKNRQLETNWDQKAEELEKAKNGWIQRYRIEHENDEALKKLTSRLGAIENISADSVSRLFTDSAKLATAGWEDVTKAYAKAVEYVEKDGTKHNMLVSPVLPNGKVLSPKEFEEYISKAVSSADYRKMAPDSIVIGIDVKDDAKNKVAELQAAYSSLFENVGVEPEKRKEILKKALAGAGTGELDIAKAENDIKQIVERIKAIPGVEFLSEDSLDKLAELSGKILALQGKKVGLTVDVDKKSVEEEIASIEARIASLKNRPFKESENELVRLNARLIELKGQLAGVQMKVDTEDAKSELEDIKAEIRSIPGLSLLTDEQINKLGEASEDLIRMKNLMDLKVRLVAETNDVNKKVEEIKERFGTLPITFTAADEITTSILADASGAREELASLKKDVPVLSILAPDASAQLKALATRLNELKLGVDTEEARQEIKNVKDQIAAIPGVEVLSDSDIAKIAKIEKLENIATSVTVDTASAENAISEIKEELSKNNELLPAEEIDKIAEIILSLAQLKDKQINLSVNTNEADKELASLRDKVVSIPVVGQLGENELSRLASLFSDKPILQEVSIETDTSQIDNALSEINNRITTIPGVEAVSGDALSTLVQYSSLLGTTKKEIGALAVEEEDAAGSAEKAWQAFYDKQEAMARRYIERQKEYNRKVAQEQINDKASKWLEEMMKENNIDFHDMGDKSLEQVNILISRIEELVSSESLASLIPDELKDDAKLINAEFSQLFSTIKKMANTKIGDLNVEKMKKTVSRVKSLLSIIGMPDDLDFVSDAQAELAQALTEVANAQEDVNLAMDEMDKAQNEGNAEDLQKAIDNLAKAEENLAKKTQNATNAQSKFNGAIAFSVLGVLSSALKKVSSSMKEIAEATNDAGMSSVAEGIGMFAETVSAAVQGGKQAGIWGAFAATAVSAIGQIIDAFVKYEQEVTRAKKLVEELKIEIVSAKFAEQLEADIDTLFGENSLKKLRNAADGFSELKNRAGDLREEFEQIKQDRINSVYGAGMGGGGYDMSGYQQWLRDNMKSWEDLSFEWTPEGDWRSTPIYNLREIAEKLGMDLYDKNGNPNKDFLKNVMEILDIDGGYLQKLIEYSEDYEKAMQQLADGLKAIFGEVGDSIAESLVSAFELSGEAALDTEDIFKSVARSFVKEWTQAFLMKNYLSGLSDAVTGIWQDTGLSADEQIAQSLDLVRDAFAAIGDQLPAIQKFYEGMEDQFHWADGAGEELGDAIKTAMVEQNSSLIAGYINSMRADLSMQRNEIMRSISPAVTSINTTLNDHLASVKSIEGNVANIWNKLNLLTSSGSGVKLNARI